MMSSVGAMVLSTYPQFRFQNLVCESDLPVVFVVIFGDEHLFRLKMVLKVVKLRLYLYPSHLVKSA